MLLLGLIGPKVAIVLFPAACFSLSISNYERSEIFALFRAPARMRMDSFRTNRLVD